MFAGITRLHLLIGLFALILYLPGFWWGAPTATSPQLTHSWGTDDETPLGPLAEMHNIIQPKADRNLGYPLMYSFMVSAAYTPYLTTLWFSGDIQGISGVYPFGLRDPVTTLRVLTCIAHLVTVLMAVGIVVSVFEAARVLWGPVAGVAAALLSATSYPMFYYARTGNVDVPMLFFIAAATAVFAHCLAAGLTLRRCIWLGIFAGFAMATKESALGAFILVPLILFWWQRQNDYSWLSLSFWKMPLAASGAAFLALGVGSGLFVEPSRYIDHINYIAGRTDEAASETVHAVMIAFPFTVDGNIEYLKHIAAYLVDMMTWLGVLLCIAGLIVVLWKSPKSVVLALVGLGYLLFLFVAVRSVQMRYLLPVPMFLSFASAWFVHYLWSSPSAARRIGAGILVSGIILYGILRGVALSYEMMNDSRIAAGAWLAENSTEGDLVEYFGPGEKLPPLNKGVHALRATDYHGMRVHHKDGDDKIMEILQGWNERRPRFVILAPDYTSRNGQPFNISCPEKLCSAMIEGTAEMQEVMMFKTPPLFPWLDLPELDYPTVNPEIRVFSMVEAPGRQ